MKINEARGNWDSFARILACLISTSYGNASTFARIRINNIRLAHVEENVKVLSNCLNDTNVGKTSGNHIKIQANTQNANLKIRITISTGDNKQRCIQNSLNANAFKWNFQAVYILYFDCFGSFRFICTLSENRFNKHSFVSAHYSYLVVVAFE